MDSDMDFYCHYDEYGTDITYLVNLSFAPVSHFEPVLTSHAIEQGHLHFIRMTFAADLTLGFHVRVSIHHDVEWEGAILEEAKNLLFRLFEREQKA